MLTEDRIREVLAALPGLLADARAAGDEFLPVDRLPEALAARMPNGERAVELIRDLHRIVEIHGFLSGAGSLANMRERLADPAWAAVVAQQRPDQAGMIAERARELSERLRQIPAEEEAAVRACGAQIDATMARLSRG